MPNLKRWLLALVVGLSLVGAALAQVAKKQAEVFRDLFAELDANRDNAIERDEVPESARSAFDRLLKRGDDNHNGKLESEEYRSLLVDLREIAEQTKKQAVARFTVMDKDGDGKVSRDEFTGPKPRFNVLDRDGDGFLSQQEMMGAVQGKAAGKIAAKKKLGAGKKAVADGKKPEDVKKAE
jgi:Ca2+-binding EF-hand superfamily protein